MAVHRSIHQSVQARPCMSAALLGLVPKAAPIGAQIGTRRPHDLPVPTCLPVGCRGG